MMTVSTQPIIPFIHRLSSSQVQSWLSAFSEHSPDLNIVEFDHLNPCHYDTIKVAIVANPEVQQLALLSNLVWLQSLWAGVDNLISTQMLPSIKIAKMSDPQLAQDMANSVLTWCLYLQQQIPQYRLQQQAKIWQPRTIKSIAQTNISILGLGQLGAEAGKKLVQHGFSVSGWSRHPKQIDGIRCYSGKGSLNDSLQRADILISLLPLTSETRQLLNQQRLSWLPEGAAVVNFSRGAIVEQTGLIVHLDSGHLSHAILDVFEIEPLAKSHPFWSHPKITVLPHITAKTNINTASTIAAENLQKFIKNGQMPNLICPKYGY